MNGALWGKGALKAGQFVEGWVLRDEAGRRWTVMAAALDGASVSDDIVRGLTHLPRRTQVDEAVFPVELRRWEDIRYGERRLYIYDFVDISGWFRRSRHGDRKVFFFFVRKQIQDKSADDDLLGLWPSEWENRESGNRACLSD